MNISSCIPARRVRLTSSGVIAAALALVVGCATTGSTLSDAAYRLERSADALYSEVRRDSGDRRLEADAEAFAEVASDFHREVKDDAERDELRRDFERVAQRYHALRDEYEDSRRDSDRRSAFADVTSAYLDLERELEHKRVSGL